MVPKKKATQPIPDGVLLTGHVAEWGELLTRLAERHGITVFVADPLSGASGLLDAALRQDYNPVVLVDARSSADLLDLAAAIGDATIASLAADAHSWWVGQAPVGGTVGLRLSRFLRERGIDPDPLRLMASRAPQPIAVALEIASLLADGPLTIAVDHLGGMLANLRDVQARQILEAIRTSRQRRPSLDLVLVDHPNGPIAQALEDPEHPLFLAGEVLRLRRPTPDRMVEDLAITRPLVKAQVAVLRAAAELAAGVPSLTWQIVEMAPPNLDPPAGAVSGWNALRRANATSVSQNWDLLRRVHPAAQKVTAAMSIGIKPHASQLAPKTVDDALNRLRDVGMAWQPAERTWAIADPLLAAYARDTVPAWTIRRREAR
jgi:hypothetical protein